MARSVPPGEMPVIDQLFPIISVADVPRSL
jgi:hypothetical protein